MISPFYFDSSIDFVVWVSFDPIQFWRAFWEKKKKKIWFLFSGFNGSFGSSEQRFELGEEGVYGIVFVVSCDFLSPEPLFDVALAFLLVPFWCSSSNFDVLLDCLCARVFLERLRVSLCFHKFSLLQPFNWR